MGDPLELAERPAFRRAACAVLLGLMAALLVLSSLHKRLVYDEYDNLSYGYRFLTRGPGVSPEGQRMPVLVLNALGCASNGCDLDAVNASEAARLRVRAASMAAALCLAALIGRWGTELGGPAMGLAALWIAVFDPTLLGHGKQVTSDVAVALFMTAAVYFARRWWRRPTVGNVAGCAVVTAAAILSKFTGLLLVPILGVMVVARAVAAWRAGWRPTKRDGLRAAGTALAFAASVLFLVNAAYLFKGTLRRADTYAWTSRAFQERLALPIPLPLPRAFAQGLDYSAFLQEHHDLARGNNYVLGERNRDGRWYAFPLMLLLKTPLAVFVLALVAVRRWKTEDAVPLAALFLVVMAVYSLAVDPQLGIRYVLPALPALHLAAARAAQAGARWRRLVPVMLAWQAVSVVSYHPHPIAYFNELIGRRVNAWRYLADSNLDWEDHDWWIERYRRAHPERPLVVSPAAPRAGWILVGANDLVGVFDAERYRWLRESFEPVGHVAYAHLLFYVPPDQISGAGR